MFWIFAHQTSQVMLKGSPVLPTVSQGSVLDTILFFTFISDNYDVIDFYKLLYADDITILYCMKSLHDCLLLENCLNSIFLWTGSSSAFQFTPKLVPIKFSNNLDKINLFSVFTFRDFGVTSDSKLMFTFHLVNIDSSALQKYGFLCRNTRDSLLLFVWFTHICHFLFRM